MSGLSATLTGRLGALVLDVALEVPAGVTALVGPSGSGKTTILRAIAGLERLKGAVSVGGETWQDARRFTPPHRRAAGYVFQHHALLPHLTVRGNLDYARKRSGAEAAEFDRVVDWLRLAPLLARAPERLSGGERARVALARTLLTRPRVLLLDEPLAGLDVEARSALIPELAGALKALDLPVLYVSHDPAEVARIAQRVIRLRAGRLDAAPDPAAGLDALPPDQLRALAAAALRAGLEP